MQILPDGYTQLEYIQIKKCFMWRKDDQVMAEKKLSFTAEEIDELLLKVKNGGGGGGSDITTEQAVDLLLELDMVSAVTDNNLILTDENSDILLW